MQVDLITMSISEVILVNGLTFVTFVGSDSLKRKMFQLVKHFCNVKNCVQLYPLVARKSTSITSVEHKIREICDVITRFILMTNHTNVRFVVINADGEML